MVDTKEKVMDGDDLSAFDNMGVDEEEAMEDNQTLDKLEWELASDTGRITADGQISRMSMLDDKDDVASGGSSSRSSARSLRMSADKDYDVTAKLREDERRAEEEEEGDEFDTHRSVSLDQNEVRALR